MGFCWSENFFGSVNDVYLRFTFLSDSIESDQEGWMMDNFYAYSTIVDQTIDFSERSLSNVNIYPNPTCSLLNITFVNEENTKLNYQILNSNGITQLQGKDIYSNNFKIDITQLSIGMYYLVLNNEQG